MKPCNHDSHELYEKLIEPMREEAKRLGYALAVHGSLIRDIDLVACPWTTDAVPARELADALQAVAEKVHGFALNKDMIGSANPPYFEEGAPGGKPHGRLCWSFWLNSKSYIDLSVMPRMTRLQEDAILQAFMEAQAKENVDRPLCGTSGSAESGPASGPTPHEGDGDTQDRSAGTR